MVSRDAHLDRLLGVEQVGDGERGLHLALGRLVEGEVGRLAAPQFVDRLPAVALGALDAPRVDVEEAQPQVRHGLPGSLQETLGQARRGLGGGGEPRRHEHPELPADPVLGRRGPVGVEQVALVEHRVGHLPGDLHRHGHPRVSLSSSSSASSQAGQGAFVLEPVQVPQRVAAQPQPARIGEVAVHQLPPDSRRQPVPGLAVPRHLLHGEAALRPENTVPLKSRSSGISPSSSEAKYLPAATSRS